MARISVLLRSTPWITSGIHACNGAIPSFIARARVIMAVGIGVETFWSTQCPSIMAAEVQPAIRVQDAKAWARKYFVAASVIRGWCLFVRRGTMAIVLISSPIQAVSQ